MCCDEDPNYEIMNVRSSHSTGSSEHLADPGTAHIGPDSSLIEMEHQALTAVLTGIETPALTCSIDTLWTSSFRVVSQQVRIWGETIQTLSGRGARGSSITAL
ncbi:hypothetical protein RRG08_031197 [Elysia crispata]|uniref:Uncharacterized protein n=1 Tax=Elysia crispata TaxID=231223 RepID=A0AAE0XNB4_9GAST|nr:hypothetical protein RRG08_031197 [Elysia crispata]